MYWFKVLYKCPNCSAEWDSELNMEEIHVHSDGNAVCGVCGHICKPANDELFRAAFEEMYGKPFDE